MFSIQKKGPKYDVSTTVRCPLCEDDIQVGTAGPRGLEQHQGKKKCLATIEKKKQDERSAKNLTLFSFLQRKDKGEPLSAAEAARDIKSRNAESSSRIIVRPLSALEYADKNHRNDPGDGGLEGLGTQDDNGKDDARTDERGEMSNRRKGCRDGWRVLDQLRGAIGKIPYNVPEAKSSDELAGYNRSTALSACSGIPQDEIWENINPGLDRMLGFGRPKGEIQELVRRGEMGVQGFCEYLEVLVDDGGIVGGLIEGKVSALVEAIEG